MTVLTAPLQFCFDMSHYFPLEPPEQSVEVRDFKQAALVAAGRIIALLRAERPAGAVELSTQQVVRASEVTDLRNSPPRSRDGPSTADTARYQVVITATKTAVKAAPPVVKAVAKAGKRVTLAPQSGSTGPIAEFLAPQQYGVVPMWLRDITYPSESVIARYQHIQNRCYVSKSLICEGNGLFAGVRLSKDMIITLCGGRICDMGTTDNLYLMQVKLHHMDKIIDGKPTERYPVDFTKWGYSNSNIWDIDGNNAKVTKRDGHHCLVATRVILPNEEIMWHYGEDFEWSVWHYGEDFDWSDVVLHRNIPQLFQVLHQVDAMIMLGRHAQLINDIELASKSWTAADVKAWKQQTDPYNRLIMRAASGQLPLTERHYFIPTNNGDFGIALPMILSCEIVYRNIAHGQMGNPKGCPDLKMLSSDSRVRTTGGTRQSTPRSVRPTVTGPTDELDAVPPPWLFPGTEWRSNLVIKIASATPLNKRKDNHGHSISSPRYEHTRTASIDIVVAESDLLEEVAAEKVTAGVSKLSDSECTRVGIAEHCSGSENDEFNTMGEPETAPSNQPVADSLNATESEIAHTLSRQKWLGISQSMHDGMSTATHGVLLDKVANLLAPPPKVRDYNAKAFRTYIQNVGTLTDDKIRDLGPTICNNQVDVCILVDVGITVNTMAQYTVKLKQAVGPGYSILIFPTERIGSTAVGGAVVILHSRVKSKKVNQLAPFGTLVEVKGIFGRQPFSVYGIYSAVSAEESVQQQEQAAGTSGSLCDKVQAALPPDSGTTHEHLRLSLLEGCALSMLEARTIFVGGDFNSPLTADNDRHDFGSVLSGIKLGNSSGAEQAGLPSYRSGKVETRIDHMYHSDTAKVYVSRLLRTVHHDNGHAGLLTGYFINRGAPNRWKFVLRQLAKRMQDFKIPEVTADFTEKFKKLVIDRSLPLAEQLDKLTCDTVQIVYPRRIKPARKGQSRDWSPESRALELHLKRVVTLKSLLQRRIAPSVNTYLKVVQLSTQAIVRLVQSAEHLVTYEELTLYNSAYWEGRTPETAADVIIQATAELKKELTDENRKRRRKAFLAAQQKSSYDAQMGRIKAVSQSLLGSKRKSYKLETLEEEDSTNISPGDIHAKVTDYFGEWMACPGPPPPWKEILTDRDAFGEWSSSLGIPTHLQEYMWSSISSRPPPSEALDDFRRKVDARPEFEELLTELKHAKKDLLAACRDYRMT